MCAFKQRYGCQSLGFLTCTQMLMHAIPHGGCANTGTESALTADSGSGRGILAELNLHQHCAAPASESTEPHPSPQDTLKAASPWWLTWTAARSGCTRVLIRRFLTTRLTGKMKPVESDQPQDTPSLSFSYWLVLWPWWLTSQKCMNHRFWEKHLPFKTALMPNAGSNVPLLLKLGNQKPERILSLPRFGSVCSMPGNAAATRRNNCHTHRKGVSIKTKTIKINHFTSCNCSSVDCHGIPANFSLPNLQTFKTIFSSFPNPKTIFDSWLLTYRPLKSPRDAGTPSTSQFRCESIATIYIIWCAHPCQSIWRYRNDCYYDYYYHKQIITHIIIHIISKVWCY